MDPKTIQTWAQGEEVEDGDVGYGAVDGEPTSPKEPEALVSEFVGEFIETLEKAVEAVQALRDASLDTEADDLEAIAAVLQDQIAAVQELQDAVAGTDSGEPGDAGGEVADADVE